MIKLTNSQSTVLLSAPIRNLFNDDNRQFPTADAFKLSDLLADVQIRMKPYFEQLQKIAKGCGATIEPSGIIRGLTPEAQKEVIELNRTELEYNFEKLAVNDGWPKLSLSEASALRPLLNFNGDKQNAT